MRQVQTHDTFMRLQHRRVHCKVRRRTRKHLHVHAPFRRVQSIRAQRTVLAQALRLVDELVPAVIPLSRQTFRVFIRQARPIHLHHCLGRKVFARDEFQSKSLSLLFLQQNRVQFRVQRLHAFVLERRRLGASRHPRRSVSSRLRRRGRRRRHPSRIRQRRSRRDGVHVALQRVRSSRTAANFKFELDDDDDDCAARGTKRGRGTTRGRFDRFASFACARARTNQRRWTREEVRRGAPQLGFFESRDYTSVRDDNTM